MIVLAATVGGFGVAILEIIKLALAKRLAIDQPLVGGWSRLSGSSCVRRSWLADLPGQRPVDNTADSYRSNMSLYL